jgi:hypothetical protein
MQSNGKKRPGDKFRHPERTIPEITEQVNIKSGLVTKKTCPPE